MNCRICIKSSDNLIQLNDEIRGYFYSVTQIKLIKLEKFSNSICSSCCDNLKSAFDYRSELISIQHNFFHYNSEIFDPIPTSSSDDLNTILLIKQEPTQGTEILNNSLDFIDERQQKSDSSSSNCESDEEEKIKTEYSCYKKKKKPIDDGYDIIHCSHCDENVKKDYYKKHLTRVHSAETHLICDICNHQSHFKTTLEIHMTKHFNNIKPFVCKECSSKFRTKKDLRLHVNSSHRDIANPIELFICETCGKSFKFKKLLDVHVRSNHTLERPFKCDELNCTAAYFCNSNLVTHKKRAHSHETVTCEVCGKIFNSLINLNEHVRKNHKEGQHICPAVGCGRRFITPYYLSLHAKTHYGIKDRECEMCGQRFYNKKHLNQHVEVAHKKSRFYCQVPGCSSVFSRKCNIREHVRKIHRELTEEMKQQLLSDITKMKPIYMTNSTECNEQKS